MFRKKAGKKSRKTKDQETEPERILQLKQLSDMLLAGGYFRARIPTLSPFDKIIGGLVWSITASGESVDVDLIFQENSTIGDRIILSESIVTALLKMKCPFPIQPNQIQGLDYDNIFPVVRWLIKSVLENRRLTGDRVRQLAEDQFSRTYSLMQPTSEAGLTYVGSVHDVYRPTRQFRKAIGVQFSSREQETEATLLEYGERSSRVIEDAEAQDRAQKRGGKSRGGKSSEGEPVSAREEKKSRKAEAKHKKLEAEEQKRLEELQEQLAEAKGEAKVSTAAVGKVITMQSAGIKAMAATYEEVMEKQAQDMEEHNIENSAQKAAEMQFQRKMENLQKKALGIKRTMEEKKVVYDAAAGKVEAVRTKIDAKRNMIQRIAAARVDLENKEKNASTQQKAMLNSLKALVLLNENLKNQEKKFKETCKAQHGELTRQLQELEDGSDGDQETKKMREIEKIHQADSNKLDRIRQALAKKNQAIAQINRQIDDIPTRAELLQFERRFVELYELVGEKLIETRKYYNMYNTLDDSHNYMRQECDLLNQIIQGFPVAARSKTGRVSYKKQVSGILAGIEKTKEAVNQQYTDEAAMRDLKLQKYSTLQERQRAYFKAVKEFQEECGKNEQLVAGLEGLQKKVRQARG